MLDPVSLEALGDEIEKIAVAKRLGTLVAKGWKDIGGQGARGGWFGKADTWRRHIPVGGKTLTAVGTAAAVPGVMKARDPLGRERSRTERATTLGAGTLGGLAGFGAALGRSGKAGIIKSMVGGIGGAMGAEYLASKPFQAARMRRLQGPVDPNQRKELLGRLTGEGVQR